MKKITIMFCTIIVILSGCSSERENGQITEYVAAEKIETTLSVPKSAEVYEDLSTLPQEIQDILYENETFFEVENQKEYTKVSYRLPPNDITKQLEWGQYIVFDFDKDGEKELAVMLQEYATFGFIAIFDKQEDMVYEYSFGQRGFCGLYTDGAILGTSAADTYMYYNVKFNKNTEEDAIIADATSEETLGGQYKKVWYVAGKKVSKEKFRKFTSRYEENKKIPWSRRTLDEVIQ